MRKIPFWLLVLSAFIGVYFLQTTKRDDRNVASVRAISPTSPPSEEGNSAKSDRSANSRINSAPRAPASKTLLSDTLPPSIRDRAKFDNVDGGFVNRRHVRVSIDDAELIGANITVNETGDKVIKSHMPEVPAQLARFPQPETERLKDKIDAELRKTGNLETVDSVLIRKMWLPIKSDKKLQPAVEFLVKSRNKDTSQIIEEVFQFDPGSGELLTRYEPVRR